VGAPGVVAEQGREQLVRPLGGAGDAPGQRLLALVEVDLETGRREGAPAEAGIVALRARGGAEEQRRGGGERARRGAPQEVLGERARARRGRGSRARDLPGSAGK
jgi:hypothetical protein